MTTLGTLGILNSSGSVIYTMGFFNLNFPDGWPFDVDQNIVEPITARGVNNTRMRIVRQDFRRFRMRGLSESSNFASAAALAAVYAGYEGTECQLAFTAGGNSFTFTDNLYLWDLSPVPLPAQLASTIASDSSLGIVDTMFTLQFVN